MSVSLGETRSAERLSLEIPPDSAHILTARLFAGGVGRSLGLDDETADLLKLALTEICSEAIEQRRGGRIVIDVSADTDPVRVTVAARGVRGDRADTDQTETTYRRSLIEASVPEATFDEQEDRLIVTFPLSGDV
jgi:anti-sigma regulatory factor (Ser/Thr protein kinase)